ncbi:MAG TPA: NUDIX domain-containing protein [Xanthobacteraceae bacterium]|jgi:8-oxo-dGTP pyrophosphatase MutT (NUDIX family)|nr:NUDIX domain-containing protein [Xanthobacteraceae bacterium]
MLPTHFLTDDCPLQGDNAVAAIITVEDGRYLMQLRDDIPRIFYPGHWGCFGGAVGSGENPVQALNRELAEELEMEARPAKEFVSLDFDLAKVGQKKCYRTYYEIKVTEAEVSRYVLHEGAEMRLFKPDDLFDARLTPYDSFALWLHFARHRFSPIKTSAGVR